MAHPTPGTSSSSHPPIDLTGDRGTISFLSSLWHATARNLCTVARPPPAKQLHTDVPSYHTFSLSPKRMLARRELLALLLFIGAVPQLVAYAMDPQLSNEQPWRCSVSCCVQERTRTRIHDLTCTCVLQTCAWGPLHVLKIDANTARAQVRGAPRHLSTRAFERAVRSWVRWGERAGVSRRVASVHRAARDGRRRVAPLATPRALATGHARPPAAAHREVRRPPARCQPRRCPARLSRCSITTMRSRRGPRPRKSSSSKLM